MKTLIWKLARDIFMLIVHLVTVIYCLTFFASIVCVAQEIVVSPMAVTPPVAVSGPPDGAVALVDSVSAVNVIVDIRTYTVDITISSDISYGVCVVNVVGGAVDSVKIGTTKFTLAEAGNNISSFYLVNPPSGAKTISMFTVDNGEHATFVATFSGVDQTTPVGTCGEATQGYGASVSTSMTLATNDYGLVVLRSWNVAATPTSPMTVVVNRQFVSNYRMTIGKITGNASVTCEWSFSDCPASVQAIPIKKATP